MPLYQIRCLNCGKIEERIQAFDNDLPYCCGKYMERMMSACNFSVGWRYSEKSFERGQPMKLVRNV